MTAELVEGRRRGRADRDAHVAEAPAEAGPPAHASARVDLVPPVVETRRRYRAIERRLLTALLALLVLVVAASLGVAFLAIQAENTLAAERTRSQTLINAQKQYTEVSNVMAQVGAYDGAAVAALFAEANWARLMTELDSVLPAGVTIATESITVKGAAPGATADVESTGLDTPGVIEIAFTANADRFDSPTPLLNALSRLTGYVSATVEAVAASNDAGYVITGVVQLGADALGGTARVGALDPDLIATLHEQLELAATTPPAPSTPTSDAPDATTKTTEGQ